MKILIFIPARGGSKGIPGKNLVKMNGKPLIQYTLETADNLVMDKSFEWLPFVSTDNEKIAIKGSFNLLLMSQMLMGMSWGWDLDIYYRVYYLLSINNGFQIFRNLWFLRVSIEHMYETQLGLRPRHESQCNAMAR